MTGKPVTRAMGPNGQWAYTLYQGSDAGPFVHALDTSGRSAKCIDLDGLNLPTNLSGSRLVVSGDGDQLTILRHGSELGTIDTHTFAVSPPSRPSNGHGFPWVLIAILALVAAAGAGITSRVVRRRRGLDRASNHSRGGPPRGRRPRGARRPSSRSGPRPGTGHGWAFERRAADPDPRVRAGAYSSPRARLRMHSRNRMRGLGHPEIRAPSWGADGRERLLRPKPESRRPGRRDPPEPADVDLNRNFPVSWEPIGVPWDLQYSAHTVLRARDAHHRETDPQHSSERDHLVPPGGGADGPGLGSERSGGATVRPLPAAGALYARPVPPPTLAARAAPNWQNHRFPGTASFVVELPPGPLPHDDALLIGAAVARLADRGLSGPFGTRDTYWMNVAIGGR